MVLFFEISVFTMQIHITSFTQQISGQQELPILISRIHNVLQKIEQPYTNEYRKKLEIIEKAADLFEKIHMFFSRIQQPHTNKYQKNLEIQNRKE